MSDDRAIDDLIGRVYDAALDEALWAGLAPRIAAAFGSPSAALQLRDTRRGAVELLTLTSNLHVPALADYQAYYWQHDVWVERAAQRGMARVLASKDLIADAEFAETEFYRDWCRKVGQFYVVGAVFPVGDGQIAALGCHRPREAGSYDEADKSRVARFLPHLRRALQIRQRLAPPGIEYQAAQEAAARDGTAVLVAARDGRVIHADWQVEALLRAGDAIRVRGGRLCCPLRAAADRLAALVRAAADTAAGSGESPGGALAIPREGRPPLTLLVAPFRGAANGSGMPVPAAILFIRDPERGAMAARQVLQSLFGLTPAEAALACALADGISIEEIAARGHTSLNTARTHLKSIFAKTGTGRQAQLVVLILRSVAGLAAP